MLKKLLIALGLIIITGGAAFGQAGTLKGTVTDAENKQPMEDVTVKVELGGAMIKGTMTNEKGEFSISNLELAREYDIVFTSVGYSDLRRKVRINANNVTVLDVAITPTIRTTGEIIIEAEDPLIKKGTPEQGKTYTPEEMAYIPTNSVDGIAAMTAGIGYEDGGQGAARGEGGMVTIVNGVRKRGAVNIPKDAIAELQYILGGTPAKYGEAMGGVQVITLQPPASNFTGNVEYQTTELFDTRGYNRLQVYFTGPILKKKVEVEGGGSTYDKTIIGYRLSGVGNYTRDQMYRPHDDAYKMLNDDVLSDFIQTPLVINPVTNIVSSKADYFHADDFSRQINKSNLWNMGAYLEGGVDFRFTDNMFLKLTGEFTYSNRMVPAGIEMNNAYNGKYEGYEYRIGAEFEQRFANLDTSLIIKNLAYNISGSYASTLTESKSEIHQDRLFDYGYIGKFDTKAMTTYTMQRYTIDGVEMNAMVQNGYMDTAVYFTPSSLNPAYANYTGQLYADDRMRPALINFNNIRSLRGLVNGDSPTGGYSLFTLPGAQSSYSKSQVEALNFQARVSGTIGSHALELGFQYDQLTSRSYGVSARGLWTLMRQLANVHIAELDISNPVIDQSGMYPIVTYGRKYDAASQTYFDKALREKLGKPIDGSEYLYIDAYDPSTYSMDMFSPDELFDNGNSYVTYKGYDHTGKKVSGKKSLQDFFNNSSRTLGAYTPIYMAGYIQDQFYIRDLIFNIGVRVDRFDGNQMVLKDPYLLYDSYTVGEVSGLQNEKNGGSHPAGAQNDWVVYVDDFQKGKEAKITGYRSGNIWYDANGIELSSSKGVSGALARPTPYRKDPTLKPDEISVNVFRDYDPVYVIMPRIAFSFPVSDESQFKASYDMIANRPSANWEANYVDYMFLESRTAISNPDLKPERVTNYEIAFEQTLGAKSVVRISAYYKEIRDLISLIQYDGADPNPNLYSYGNLDFRTTKGFTLEYGISRMKNFRLDANYTLQYVEGTTLAGATMQSLIREGYSTLKMLHPTSADRRNVFKMTPVFMFGSKQQYNGPTTKRVVKDENGQERQKTIKWLENFWVSLPIIVQSGTPYTKLYSNTQKTIVGTVNGVRLPWQFFVNMQINKGWQIEVGKKNRPTMLTAMLRLDNLLNIRNIAGVYAVTGDPDDDGYLTDPETQSVINAYTDSQAYRDMYSILLDKNSYSNYTSPRTITLSLRYQF